MSFGMVSANYLSVAEPSVPVPVLSFAFDEGTGTVIAPTNGSTTGATNGWTPGVDGMAITEGRVGTSYDPIPEFAAMPTWTELTVMLHMKRLTGSTGGTFAATLLDDTNTDFVGLCALEDTYNYVPAAWLGANDVRDTEPMPLDVWTHLAMTWSGTELKLYRDGIEVATTGCSGGLLGSGWIYLNITPWGSAPGAVDNLRIFDTALTAEQVIHFRDAAV